MINEVESLRAASIEEIMGVYKWPICMLFDIEACPLGVSAGLDSIEVQKLGGLAEQSSAILTPSDLRTVGFPC